MKNIDMRAMNRDARHKRRVRVVQLRLAGYTYDEIAAKTGLSRTGVFDICKRHEADGMEALRDLPSGRKPGAGRMLDAKQEGAVRQEIADNTPDELGMPNLMWTPGAVACFIEQRHGLVLTARTMSLYLGRWGLLPGKRIAQRASGELSSASQNWLDNDYPGIAACAKVEGAEIHWYQVRDSPGDERDAALLASTVTNKGQARWKVYGSALDAPNLIDFLRRLVKTAAKKVAMIVEDAPVHHIASVTDWLAEHVDEIEVTCRPSDTRVYIPRGA